MLHGSSYGPSTIKFHFFEKQNGRQKTKWPPNHKFCHDSLNFQVRSSRFCMVGYIYLRQKIPKTKMATKKQNGRQNTKFIITQSIFKLGAPDFAWKFKLTFHILFSKTRQPPKTKWPPKHKIDQNSLNFCARSFRFSMLDHIGLTQK